MLTPKSMGKFLGTVQSVGEGSFVLETDEQLQNGDGICFFDENDTLTGTNVNRVEGKKIAPNSMEKIAVGAQLYRNYDHEFVQLLKSNTAKRKIEIDITFQENDNGFELRMTDEDGNSSMVRLDHAKEIARKPDVARETMTTQLSKLGETDFRPRTVTLALKEMYFLPMGALNQLRRDCVVALEAERVAHYPRRTKPLERNDVAYPETSLDYSANVVNEKARDFYARHGVKQIEKGFELQTDASGKVLMTTRHCLKFQFDLCRGDKGGAEELYLSDGSNRYRLEFNCDECVMKIMAP
jgi:putative protease